MQPIKKVLVSKRTGIQKDKKSRRLAHQVKKTEKLDKPPKHCRVCESEKGEPIIYCCKHHEGLRIIIRDPLLIEGIIEWVHEHESDPLDPFDGPDEDEMIVDSGCPG